MMGRRNKDINDRTTRQCAAAAGVTRTTCSVWERSAIAKLRAGLLSDPEIVAELQRRGYALEPSVSPSFGGDSDIAVDRDGTQHDNG